MKLSKLQKIPWRVCCAENFYFDNWDLSAYLSCSSFYVCPMIQDGGVRLQVLQRRAQYKEFLLLPFISKLMYKIPGSTVYLTAWLIHSMALCASENLCAALFSKIFHAMCGTLMFFTIFTGTFHLFLCPTKLSEFLLFRVLKISLKFWIYATVNEFLEHST